MRVVFLLPASAGVSSLMASNNQREEGKERQHKVEVGRGTRELVSAAPLRAKSIALFTRSLRRYGRAARRRRPLSASYFYKQSQTMQ
ncbi:hypothetical protein EVAR_68296_1 [Eumeta japonica]|uniref:Uncharacterized protein n=1 Tax=Eumeta variegata TaxID=151549 RepID=A0A4C2AEI0_EUMVA|nr:hypothetical protein EVAR_68296_1 [Eumeta japonica]